MKVKNNEIVLKSIDYRPCYVKGKKALFHQWVEEAFPVPPSMSIIGDKGGQKKYTVGIVELENGEVIEVVPSGIVFADNLISEYVFKEDNNG